MPPVRDSPASVCIAVEGFYSARVCYLCAPLVRRLCRCWSSLPPRLCFWWARLSPPSVPPVSSSPLPVRAPRLRLSRICLYRCWARLLRPCMLFVCAPRLTSLPLLVVSPSPPVLLVGTSPTPVCAARERVPSTCLRLYLGRFLRPSAVAVRASPPALDSSQLPRLGWGWWRDRQVFCGKERSLLVAVRMRYVVPSPAWDFEWRRDRRYSHQAISTGQMPLNGGSLYVHCRGRCC